MNRPKAKRNIFQSLHCGSEKQVQMTAGADGITNFSRIVPLGLFYEAFGSLRNFHVCHLRSIFVYIRSYRFNGCRRTHDAHRFYSV